MDGQDSGAARRRNLALVREHAGSRTRTADEHMFTVERSSFRLQLFTAPGLRPVAVATQTNGEGATLMNRAERFVEAFWQRRCPAEPEPPIFIAHQLLAGKDLGFCQYGFTVAGPHTRDRAAMGSATARRRTRRAGRRPGRRGRGDGYREPEPPDEPQMRYMVAAVVALPRPDLGGEPPCMPAGTPWRRRLTRQPIPRRTGLACCWYHRQDWSAASAAAIAALAQADTGEFERDPDDPPEDQRMFAALAALRAVPLDEQTRDAAESLFLDPITVKDQDGVVPYVNGRHRVQAMLDAGVHRTVVGRFTYPGGIDASPDTDSQPPWIESRHQTQVTQEPRTWETRGDYQAAVAANM